MDYLVQAIRNMSAKEAFLLERKLRNQPKKLRLLETIRHSDHLTNAELSQAVSYGDNLRNLYTLKNRVHDDLMSVKFTLSRNEIIRTRELVYSIKPLVYSKDKQILLRELKKLKSKCERLELYNELHEVLFCIHLLSDHNAKKQEQLKSQIKAASTKQRFLNRMEEHFYFNLLKTQELFFYPHPVVYKQSSKLYLDMERIHAHLNSEASQFLILSAYLTLNLNNFLKQQEEGSCLIKLNELSELYLNSYVSERYPNCQVAIDCLYSRFYFLTDQQAKFEETQHSIEDRINKVRGYQMFDSSFLYFLYVEILYARKNNDFNKIIRIVDHHLNEEAEPADLSTLSAFGYLIALKEFYRGKHTKCTSTLLKYRLYFNYLSIYSGWSAIENILLSIINRVVSKDFITIDSEISLLKRTINKFKLDKTIHLKMRPFLKAVKAMGEDYDKDKLNKAIIKFSLETNLLQLIRINI